MFPIAVPSAVPSAVRVTLGACLAVIAAFAAPVAAVRADSAAAPTPAEIQQRVNDLMRRASACGTDASCLDRVRRDLEEVNRQLRALSEGAKGPGTPPPAANAPGGAVQDAGRAQAAAERNLAGRRNDPCHPVLLEKEFARLYTGSDLPWVVCTPVRFDLTWAFDDLRTRHAPFPADTARYRLRETYPGHVKVVYDQHNRHLVRQVALAGPSGAAAAGGSGAGRSVLESLSAALLAEFPPGPVNLPDASGARSADPNQVSRTVIRLLEAMLDAGGPRYATVQTTRTDAFRVGPGTGSFSFGASSDYGPRNRYLSQELSIEPARVEVIEERLLSPPGRLVDHDVPVNSRPSAAIWDRDGKLMTVAEVMAALNRGVLEKTLPVHHRMDVPSLRMVLESRGTLSLRVAFGPPPTLAVSPAQGLRAEGTIPAGTILPPGRAYVLSNPGKVPLRFAVTADKPWLTATPAGGEIAAGGQARVHVAFDTAQAAKLAAGLHGATVTFTNTSSGKGDTTRPVALDMAPEQVWRVSLNGHRYVKHREVREILDPGASKGRYIDYFHGFDFTYAMAAEFVLRKKKKRWVYKSGRITGATVMAAYHQQPELYAVDRIVCVTCSAVTRLKGTALAGLVQGDRSVVLYWPNRTPMARVHSRLRLKCWPGPSYNTCMGQKKQGATYSMEDTDFLQRADDHVLPLRDGPFHPVFSPRPTSTGQLLIDHRYVLKRLK